MKKNELIKQIVEKLTDDNSMLKTIGELALDIKDIVIAEEQLPDTMYVLTVRMRVKTDDKETFHYHPIIKDCLLNPNATDNEMLASPNLIDLQKDKEEYTFPLEGVEFVILAVPYEEYKVLKAQFDETIADIIANARHATEEIMKNMKYLPTKSLDFGRVYTSVLYQIATTPQSVIGSALNDKSKIINNINKTGYEHFNTPKQFSDSCNGDCCNCKREVCIDEEEDGGDEEDDPDDSEGHNSLGWFFNRKY